MLLFCLTVDEDVIQKHHYTFVKHVSKKRIHGTHEGGRRISKTKRHHTPFILPVASQKSSFMNIRFFNSTLPIPTSQIQAAEYFGVTQLIQQIFVTW